MEEYDKSIRPLDGVVEELKKDELDFLRMNNASLTYARPNGSRRINKMLWEDFDNAQKNAKIQSLSRWIKKAPLQKDEVLLRATYVKKSDYERGYFINNAFVSASLSMKYTQFRLEQLTEKSGCYRAILFIEAKKGDKFAPPLILKNGRLVGSVNETEKTGDFGQKLVFIKDKTYKGVDSVGEIMYFYVRVESR